ncbi:glycosyltransferase [Xenococcus sp. PCC 7305]|uniref:glycosyltransferase n=1 Tax=Xenococcus sp. PCC 7305 TaxID=102125 RepID=UPI0002ABD0B1|nr:glycosyltransferase [Xenococcus sp. PCC 7305]ELS03858.1 glycosyltransferase [Xenococcus sp. PCC 7305]
MKKKLVFLISDLTYGGAQRQLLALAKAIDKEIFEVYVLHYYPDGPLEQDLKDAEVILSCITKKGRWDLIGFYWRLLRYLQRINPDILHSYLSIPNLFSIFFKPFLPRTKIIWGIRDSNPLDTNNLDNNNKDWLGFSLALLENFMSQFPDLIVANSHAGKKYRLSQGFPADKTIVIPNGIDTKRFQPDPVGRTKVREEWGLSPETIAIGIIGRVNPKKDHPNFLRAAAMLAGERKNLRFFCIGADEGGAEYQQAMYRLGEELGLGDQLVWTGGRSDIPAVCEALDIVVSASAHGEGFGNVIGEAMACNTPCVVTDVGDSAWIVGDFGKVVPAQNSPALAKAIEELIVANGNNKPNIRQQIVDRFSINQLALASKEAFLKVLETS